MPACPTSTLFLEVSLMANYSDDTRLKLIDSEMFNWLSQGESFQPLRDFVTRRINLHLKRNGVWGLLKSRNLLDENGNVDLTKLLNPEDLQDLEDVWLREIVYLDHLNAAKATDALFWKARSLKRERQSRLHSLVLLIDEDGDGVADESAIAVTTPFRG